MGNLDSAVGQFVLYALAFCAVVEVLKELVIPRSADLLLRVRREFLRVRREWHRVSNELECPVARELGIAPHVLDSEGATAAGRGLSMANDGGDLQSQTEASVRVVS